MGGRKLCTATPFVTINGVRVTAEVADALAHNKPVVALESAIITNGMPSPTNVEVAMAVEQRVREKGAVPATIGFINGVPCAGLDVTEIKRLGHPLTDVTKTSIRDMAPVIARGQDGGTTVSATMAIAHRVGIDIFATGGIGGVHDGVNDTMDISADLTALGRIPVTVVCAGAKSILDIPRTLEYLETQGVPVVTCGDSDRFPAFWTRYSEYSSSTQVQTTGECAAIVDRLREFGTGTGMIVAVPIPAEHEASPDLIRGAIAQAQDELVGEEISGKDVTPFILQRINELTDGASVRANVQLVLNNASVAASVATKLCKLRQDRIEKQAKAN